MIGIPGTITGTLTLKRADELAVNDIIPGGDAVNGHRVVHVRDVMDPMLGHVYKIAVREEPRYSEDGWEYPARDYIFRPFDKMWVES